MYVGWSDSILKEAAQHASQAEALAKMVDREKKEREASSKPTSSSSAGLSAKEAIAARIQEEMAKRQATEKKVAMKNSKSSESMTKSDKSSNNKNGKAVEVAAPTGAAVQRNVSSSVAVEEASDEENWE